MNLNKKLTIGIPTFNGAKTILETIDSILDNINGEIASQVDILISDNASTDKTESIILNYQSKSIIQITYKKNSENIGYDKNLDSLFKHAQGDYVWTLADDDVLAKGALIEVLKAIESFTPDFLVVNFDAYDKTLSEIRHRLPLPKSVLCETPLEFFQNVNGRYGQVSSLIIQKNRWNRVDVSNAFGSAFVHIYAIYKIVLNGNALILGDPWIKVRLGSENSGTSGDSLIFIATSAVRLIHLMRQMGHDQQLIKKLLKQSERYVLDTVKKAKRIGIDNRHQAAKNLLMAYNTPKVWFRFIPLIYMPASLYRLYRRISETLKVKK